MFWTGTRQLRTESRLECGPNASLLCPLTTEPKVNRKSVPRPSFVGKKKTFYCHGWCVCEQPAAGPCPSCTALRAPSGCAIRLPRPHTRYTSARAMWATRLTQLNSRRLMDRPGVQSLLFGARSCGAQLSGMTEASSSTLRESIQNCCCFGFILQQVRLQRLLQRPLGHTENDCINHKFFILFEVFGSTAMTRCSISTSPGS